jgi:hypothetical protein
MNTYAYAGLTAALMAASAGVGAGTVVYMRPLQPSQQQAVAAPQQQAAVPVPTQGGPAPAIHTLSWYMAHDAEREAKVQACTDNPGASRLGDPECDNAFYARDRLNYLAHLKEKN